MPLLCQSGSDAITAAIKTAVLHTGKPAIIAFEGAYHGLGYAALAACGYRESFRAPFAGQLNPNVCFAPYPHREKKSSTSPCRRCVAILLEVMSPLCWSSRFSDAAVVSNRLKASCLSSSVWHTKLGLC